MDKILCQEFKPPTSVTHSIFARFTGYDRINLCVVKNTVLDIYALIDEEDNYKLNKHFNKERLDSNDMPSPRFRLRHSFKLFGNVQTMNAIRFGDLEAKAVGEPYGFDGLFLTFPNSKCSLVAYDPIKDNLRTLALHHLAEDADGYGADIKLTYAENNDRSDRNGISIACVDPLHRCIAVLGNDDQLVIIPFLQAGRESPKYFKSPEKSNWESQSSKTSMFVSEESSHKSYNMVSTDQGKNGNGKTASIHDEGIELFRSPLVLKPYIVPIGKGRLSNNNSGGGVVKSMAFLHGYFEPTLLLLQENILRTWTGSLSSVTNTCNLFALSLNLQHQQSPCIWSIKSLPYDSTHVLAVPRPMGGALVLSSNAIMYFSQNNRCGVATNGFAVTTVDKKLCNISSNSKRYRLVLNAETQCTFLDKTCALITADNGDLYLLRLRVVGDIVTALKLGRAGANANIASTIASWSYNASERLLIDRDGPNDGATSSENHPEGLLFLGSWLGDSLLLKYTEIDDANLNEENNIFLSPKLSQSSRKRPRAVEDGASVNKKAKSNSSIHDNVIDDADSEDDSDDDEDNFLYGSGGGDDDDEKGKNAPKDLKDNENDIMKSKKSLHISGTQNKTYDFSPCDVLVNIGPITSISIDEKTKRENRMAYDELRNRGEEIVCGSGYRANSGLTTLHASMELFEQMTFVLKGGKCKGSWALKVQTGPDDDDDDAVDDDDYHNLLFLAVGKQTKVLSFNDAALKPLMGEDTSFVLDELTIMADTLLDGKVAVQVLSDRIVLYWMKGSEEPGKAVGSSEITISSNKNSRCQINHIAISDPYVLVHTSDENLLVLVPEETSGKFRKQVIPAKKIKASKGDCKASCMQIFLDKNIVDQTSNNLMAPPYARPPPPILPKTRMKGLRKSKSVNFDLMGNNEEDDILYGDAEEDEYNDEDEGDTGNADGQKENIENELIILKRQKEVRSYNNVQPYILTCYDNGILEIVNLPDDLSIYKKTIKILFQNNEVANGAKVLVDSRRKLSPMANKILNKQGNNDTYDNNDKNAGRGGVNENDASAQTSSTSVIVDIKLAYIGQIQQDSVESPGENAGFRNEATCVLTIVLASGDVLVYRRHPQPRLMYDDDDGIGNDYLPLAFVRVKHSVVTRPPRYYGKKREKKNNRFENSNDVPNRSLLTYCPDISDHSMLYCNTYRPVWITVEQGYVCVYAVSLPSSSYVGRQQKNQKESNNNLSMKKYYKPAIVSMTPLNIEQCDKGLLLVHSNGNATICEMSNRVNDDERIGSEGAVTNILSGQKLILGENVRKILPLPNDLYQSPNIYAAITSKPIPGVTMKVIDEDLEKAAMIAAQELGEPYEPREKRPQYVNDEDLDELGGAPNTEDEKFYVKIIQIFDEDDAQALDDDDSDVNVEGKNIKVLHEYALENNEYGMCLQYCTIYDVGEEYMKTFLFVGTGFVKPQGNDLNGYGRVLALKPTPTGLVLHYKLSTAGGVTGIQSLRSKTVLDKLRMKTADELCKQEEEEKEKRKKQKEQKSSSGQLSENLGAVEAHEKMTNVELAKTKGGTLLVASERRLTIYEIRRGRLLCIGFYDMKVTAVNVTVIKNYVLLADVYHSLQFLRWKPHKGELELLGWDPYHNSIHNTNIYTSGYMITNGISRNTNDSSGSGGSSNVLGLLMTNNKNDIIVMEYDPQANQEIGEYTKQPLKAVSEIRLGSTVSVLHKRRIIGGALTSKQKLKSLSNNYIYGSLYGTLDGSIGMLAPIVDEKLYRRLLTLQSVLTNAIEHHCGLNPREFRYTRSKFTSDNSRPMCNRMLDLTLLMQYICLNISLQRELARSVGSNRDMIMENLRSLAESVKV